MPLTRWSRAGPTGRGCPSKKPCAAWSKPAIPSLTLLWSNAFCASPRQRCRLFSRQQALRLRSFFETALKDFSWVALKGGANAARRAERFPTRLPIHYRRRDKPDWYEAKTENISRTGVLFRGEHLLE